MDTTPTTVAEIRSRQQRFRRLTQQIYRLMAVIMLCAMSVVLFRVAVALFFVLAVMTFQKVCAGDWFVEAKCPRCSRRFFGDSADRDRGITLDHRRECCAYCGLALNP